MSIGSQSPSSLSPKTTAPSIQTPNTQAPAILANAALSLNGFAPPALKVLQIHNFYQQRGGEDIVVCNEAQLLREAGVELQTWYVESASIAEHPGWLSKLKLALKLCWNVEAQRQLRAFLKANPVDIIHLHNSFPLLSPAIIHTARQVGVPLVLTVHNFRWCKPNGTIEQIAEVQQSPWRWFGQRVYRDSRFATALMVIQIQLHRLFRSYQLCDKLICPSNFVKKALLAAGFPDRQLVVKPHSVAAGLAAPDVSANATPKKLPEISLPHAQQVAAALPAGYVLFVGRADEAKGLNFLLEAWQQLDYPLCIVGVTEQQARQWPGYRPQAQIYFAGLQTQEHLSAFYQNASLLVVPSLVAETFGNVVIEAFSHGIPCLVSDSGALPELLWPRHASAEVATRLAAGAVFKTADRQDFQQNLSHLLQQPQLLAEMSEQARHLYQAHYLPAQNQQALLACYHQVLAEQGKVVSG